MDDLDLKQLIADLEDLKIPHHVEPEDHFYSCPKSGFCIKDLTGNVLTCECGADNHNAKVDALIERCLQMHIMNPNQKE